MNRTILVAIGLAWSATAGLRAQGLEAPRPAVIRWWEAGAVLGGIAVASFFDEGIQHATQEARSRTGDEAASVFRQMGQPEVFVTLPGALLVTGVLSRRPPLRHAAARVAGSLAVAGLLVTATKFVVGRERPFQVEEPNDLKPFSGSDAFPSGHTTMAFALATALADEVRRPWATATLMAAAAGTGWSRLNDNKHWLSDVIAGAALGITSAQVVERHWTFRAVPLPSGLAVRISF